MSEIIICSCSCSWSWSWSIRYNRRMVWWWSVVYILPRHCYRCTQCLYLWVFFCLLDANKQGRCLKISTEYRKRRYEKRSPAKTVAVQDPFLLLQLECEYLWNQHWKWLPVKPFTVSFPLSVAATCCCFNDSHMWSGHYSAPAKPNFLCSTLCCWLILQTSSTHDQIAAKMAFLTAKSGCTLIPTGFPRWPYKMSLFPFPLSPFSGHLSVSHHTFQQTLLPNPASTAANTVFKTPFSLFLLYLFALVTLHPLSPVNPDEHQYLLGGLTQVVLT